LRAQFNELRLFSQQPGIDNDSSLSEDDAMQVGSSFRLRPIFAVVAICGMLPVWPVRARSFDFEFRNGDDGNDADIPGFLLTAMKGIGLNLKSGKGLVETIVIDHVEKPSQN
jgi:hypothetical protein